MYEIIDIVENFVRRLLAVLVDELRSVSIYDNGGVSALARIAVRIGEEKSAAFDRFEPALEKMRVEHERAFVERVCMSETWGESIAIGATSAFTLKKQFAVLLGCDEWDYSGEAGEYDAISPEQRIIGTRMRDRMREITGTSYGEFERARAFFAFTGKIAFIKLVRELTMDLVDETGKLTVGLKQAKEFTEAAHEEVTEDVLIFKADLRRLLEKHIVN